LICMVCQDVAQLLASSRFVWALARDSALPFSKFLCQVSTRHRIPRYGATLIVTLATPALALVSSGSTVINGLALQGGAFATLIAYTAPIACYVIAGDDAINVDGRVQWTMGSRLRKPVAYVALFIGVFIMIITCFPSGYPVTASTLAWGPVIFATVLILACLTWALYGNSHFAGPIKALLGPNAELPKAGSTPTSSLRHETTSAAHGRTARVFLASVMDPTSETSDPSSDWGNETGVTLDRFDKSQITMVAS